MNIQEIDKWLDSEYGCSYTRLEELHDWLCDETMKKDKEIERLNNIINKLLKKIQFYKTTEWGLRGFEILEYFENILTGSDE